MWPEGRGDRPFRIRGRSADQKFPRSKGPRGPLSAARSPKPFDPLASSSALLAGHRPVFTPSFLDPGSRDREFNEQVTLLRFLSGPSARFRFDRICLRFRSIASASRSPASLARDALAQGP